MDLEEDVRVLALITDSAIKMYSTVVYVCVRAADCLGVLDLCWRLNIFCTGTPLLPRPPELDPF